MSRPIGRGLTWTRSPAARATITRLPSWSGTSRPRAATPDGSFVSCSWSMPVSRSPARAGSSPAAAPRRTARGRQLRTHGHGPAPPRSGSQGRHGRSRERACHADGRPHAGAADIDDRRIARPLDDDPVGRRQPAPGQTFGVVRSEEPRGRAARTRRPGAASSPVRIAASTPPSLPPSAVSRRPRGSPQPDRPARWTGQQPRALAVATGARFLAAGRPAARPDDQRLHPVVVDHRRADA